MNGRESGVYAAVKFFFRRKLRGENEVIIQVLKAESDTEY